MPKTKPSHGCSGTTVLVCTRRSTTSARCGSKKTGSRLSPNEPAHDLGYGIRIPGARSPAGVIYTPRVAHFVVEAGLEFLSYALEAPAARRLFAMGILPPARALSIEFLHPMVWDQRIDIDVCVKEIRDHSFTLLMTAHNPDGETTFRATITQVCVSPETKRPVLLPDALRTALGESRDG